MGRADESWRLISSCLLPLLDKGTIVVFAVNPLPVPLWDRELFVLKVWDKFEWDDENKKNGNIQHLRDHSIEPEEAEGCFFHEYDYCEDDRFNDIYILDGRTDHGRRLRLVFQDKGNGIARIFTGWELKPKKKKRRR